MRTTGLAVTLRGAFVRHDAQQGPDILHADRLLVMLALDQTPLFLAGPLL